MNDTSNNWMNILLNLCTVLGVQPQYDLKNKTFIRVEFYKYYSVIVSICLVFVYLVSTWGRIKEVYAEEKSAFILTDMIKCFLLTCVHIYTSLKITFSDFEKLGKLLEFLSPMNNQSALMKKNLFQTIKFQLVFISLFEPSIIVFDTYAYGNYFGYAINNYYILEYCQFYILFIIILLAYNIIMEIKRRFNFLGNTIIESAQTLTKCKGITLVNSKTKKSSAEIYVLNSQYNKLYEIVSIFNDVFGIVILFSAVIMLFGMLNTADSSFQVFTIIGHFDLSLFCNYALWLSFYMVS